MQTPFYGSRKLAVELGVNRKRVQRLMRVMGLEAIYPKRADDAAGRRTQDLPVFTAECGDHAAQPGVVHRHHVHSAAARLLVPGGGDGLVQPLRAGLAVVEHAWTGTFCLEALEEALARGEPEIFNSDQGAQFTAAAFTGRLEQAGVAISMDGRGRALGQRVRRTAVAEREVRGGVPEGLRRRLGGGGDRWRAYFRFYCDRRIHQALGYRTPAEVYRETVNKPITSWTRKSRASAGLKRRSNGYPST